MESPHTCLATLSTDMLFWPSLTASLTLSSNYIHLSGISSCMFGYHVNRHAILAKSYSLFDTLFKLHPSQWNLLTHTAYLINRHAILAKSYSLLDTLFKLHPSQWNLLTHTAYLINRHAILAKSYSLLDTLFKLHPSQLNLFTHVWLTSSADMLFWPSLSASLILFSNCIYLSGISSHMFGYLVNRHAILAKPYSLLDTLFKLHPSQLNLFTHVWLTSSTDMLFWPSLTASLTLSSNCIHLSGIFSPMYGLPPQQTCVFGHDLQPP